MVSYAYKVRLKLKKAPISFIPIVYHSIDKMSIPMNSINNQ